MQKAPILPTALVALHDRRFIVRITVAALPAAIRRAARFVAAALLLEKTYTGQNRKAHDGRADRQHVRAHSRSRAQGPRYPNAGRRRYAGDLPVVANDGARAKEPDTADHPLQHARRIEAWAVLGR